jgi:predicted enzyme related to lactoylglutathione lyase
MTASPPPVLGSVGWIDLTVGDAPALRDFYAEVLGWTPAGLDMGGYEDFVMTTPGGEAVAGVCHARGENAALPPVWLPCFVVADLAASVAACEKRGGVVVHGPRTLGAYGALAVIRDPAGAHASMLQPPVYARTKAEADAAVAPPASETRAAKGAGAKTRKSARAAKATAAVSTGGRAPKSAKKTKSTKSTKSTKGAKGSKSAKSVTAKSPPAPRAAATRKGAKSSRGAGAHSAATTSRSAQKAKAAARKSGGNRVVSRRRR